MTDDTARMIDAMVAQLGAQIDRASAEGRETDPSDLRRQLDELADLFLAPDAPGAGPRIAEAGEAG